MPRLSLTAVLGLNKTGFDAGMAAANKQIASFGAGLKSNLLSLFSVGSVMAFGKSIADTASNIKDLQDRLGVSAKDVQQFDLAAKMGGQSVEVFAKAIEKIRVAMAKGDNPLETFGITMAQMRSGDAVAVLRALAAALENFSGSPGQTNALADMFGARQMGPVVNMLRELRNTDGTLLMSDKEVDNIDKALDLWTKIWTGMKSAAVKLSSFHPSMISAGLFSGDSQPKTTLSGIENLEQSEKDREIAARAHMATQDRILAAEKEAADIAEKTRISLLTKEQRINELVMERERLFDTIARTEEERANKQLALAKNEAEIVRLSSEQQKVDKARRISIQESALGRIGVFAGAAAQESGPQVQSLHTLKQIYSALVNKGIIVRDAR